MSDWQTGVAGRKEADRPAIREDSVRSGSRSDVARIFLLTTEDGRYALSTGASVRTADQQQAPANAVVRVSGPGHRLARLVRGYPLRLSGLDAVRLLEQVSQCGMEVAWLDTNRARSQEIIG
jgi:hypothetical protein